MVDSSSGKKPIPIRLICTDRTSPGPHTCSVALHTHDVREWTKSISPHMLSPSKYVLSIPPRPTIMLRQLSQLSTHCARTASSIIIALRFRAVALICGDTWDDRFSGPGTFETLPWFPPIGTSDHTPPQILNRHRGHHHCSVTFVCHSNAFLPFPFSQHL